MNRNANENILSMFLTQNKTVKDSESDDSLGFQQYGGGSVDDEIELEMNTESDDESSLDMQTGGSADPYYKKYMKYKSKYVQFKKKLNLA